MLSSRGTAVLLFACSMFAGASLVACGGRVDTVPPPGGDPAGSVESGNGAGSSGGARGSDSGVPTCTAMPVCDEGDEPIESKSECLADGACYTRTLCGQTISCTGSGNAKCAAVPVCPPGSMEVEHCSTVGDCESVTVCGSTILCLKSCEGPQPICDPGDTQVSGPSACLQDDAVCYSRSTCGYTIWCTGPS